MALEIQPLTDEFFPAFLRFVETAWDRPRREDYYQWRYRKAPRHLTLVARDGDKCVGALSAFTRTYRFHGARVECLEPFDWFCLPEWRWTGIGISLHQRLHKMGLPIVGCGGSSIAYDCLGRLGYQNVAEAHTFELPFRGEALTRDGNAAWKGKLAASALGFVFPLLFNPRVSWDTEDRCVVPLSRLEAGLLDLDEPTGFQPIHQPEEMDWLTHGCAALGTYVPLKFLRCGRPVGWALVHAFHDGRMRCGRILELRFHRDHLSDLPWMIRAAASVLKGLGVSFVTMTTTCDLLKEALRTCRFIQRGTGTVAVLWTKDRVKPGEPVRWNMVGQDRAWPRPTAAIYERLSG